MILFRVFFFIFDGLFFILLFVAWGDGGPPRETVFLSENFMFLLLISAPLILILAGALQTWTLWRYLLAVGLVALTLGLLQIEGGNPAELLFWSCMLGIPLVAEAFALWHANAQNQPQPKLFS